MKELTWGGMSHQNADAFASKQQSAMMRGYSVPNIADHMLATYDTAPKVKLQEGVEAREEPLSFDQAMEIVFGRGVNSETRADVMLALLPQIENTQNQRIKFIKEVWSATDDIHHLRGDLAFRLSGLAMDGEDFREALDANERAWFDRLSGKFKVYRGCAENRIDGVCWTTDRDVAVSFAKGHRGIKLDSPVVVSATCYKDDVLLAVNDREEFEIVVDPDELEDVWVEPLTMY